MRLQLGVTSLCSGHCQVHEETTSPVQCLSLPPASLHLTVCLLEKWLLNLFNHSSLVHRPVRLEINKSLAQGTIHWLQGLGADWGCFFLHSPFICQNKCWQRTLLQTADMLKLSILYCVNAVVWLGLGTNTSWPGFQLENISVEVERDVTRKYETYKLNESVVSFNSILASGLVIWLEVVPRPLPSLMRSSGGEGQGGWQGEGCFSSHHHHYNYYYYYWCKKSVLSPSWNPTKNSNPICCSHFHSFIIIITITIGHGVIILIVLSIIAT